MIPSKSEAPVRDAKVFCFQSEGKIIKLRKAGPCLRLGEKNPSVWVKCLWCGSREEIFPCFSTTGVGEWVMV
jgi:hypothetical protein